MRHLVLLSALLISGSASAAEPVAPAAPPAGVLSPGARNSGTGEPCMPANVVPARRGDPPRANKLGELPPGDLLLAVLREEDGCHVPVIVRRGIDLDAAPAEPRPSAPPRPRPL